MSCPVWDGFSLLGSSLFQDYLFSGLSLDWTHDRELSDVPWRRLTIFLEGDI